MNIIDRFKRYIAIDTKSNPENPECPSSPGQLELGRLLVEELRELGLEAYQDEHGYVYGSLKARVREAVPTIGFIAHLDTAPDMDGKCTSPKVFHYQGGDIELNQHYTMKVSDFPILTEMVGEELITTDGNTLLGADDKAGIAIIMDALDQLITKNVQHGDIKVAFTPDEEIARGADLFDVASFDADFAFTIDGGKLGELQYENFNAASVHLSIQGKNVHPGSAKNIMINSQEIAMELHSLIPEAEKPQYTQGYEGFYLLTDISGTVDHTKMSYILRDHDREKFEEKKKLMVEIVSFLNKKYHGIIQMDVADSYYNMREMVEPHQEILNLAQESMEELGIEPVIEPIRGGTDGSRLSYMGLICPNLFTGGYNFHGRFEFIPTSSMKKASELLVKIAEKNVLSRSSES